KDLNSLNGTFVNDAERLRPEKPVLLRPGDTINLAGVIVFQVASAEHPPPLPPQQPAPAPVAAARPQPPPVAPGKRSRSGLKALLLVLLIAALAAALALVLYYQWEDWFGSKTEPAVQPAPQETTDFSSGGSEEKPGAEVATAVYTDPMGLEFVQIPSGSFMMGSPAGEPGRKPDETQTLARIERPFWVQRTEVTQGQWRRIMEANPSFTQDCGEDCPVENVSWPEAQEFVRRLNQQEGRNIYRLPTEEEWEYACRAGTTDPYGGGSLEEMGWYMGNSAGRPHPVAQKKANPWGLYDMHGNVWEWTHSPLGRLRVGRGGGWTSPEQACRAAFRNPGEPAFKNNDLGLRLVLEDGRSPRPGFDCDNPFCYQAVLMAEELYAGDLDGQVGAGTLSALNRYQELLGLTPTRPSGTALDPVTCRALETSYNALAGRTAIGRGVSRTVADWCSLVPPPPPASPPKKRPYPPSVKTPPPPPPPTGDEVERARREIEEAIKRRKEGQ
ncbi:MAG: SUMF1/EgtB/PvdO family nonheme iron enzyme, partial [Thermodesulfobacteriota bacterium]